MNTAELSPSRGLKSGFNKAVIWIFTELFALHYLVSKTFYLAVYPLLFLAMKLLLFR